jgi:hypothetical protein
VQIPKTYASSLSRWSLLGPVCLVTAVRLIATSDLGGGGGGGGFSTGLPHVTDGAAAPQEMSGFDGVVLGGGGLDGPATINGCLALGCVEVGALALTYGIQLSTSQWARTHQPAYGRVRQRQGLWWDSSFEMGRVISRWERFSEMEQGPQVDIYRTDVLDEIA